MRPILKLCCEKGRDEELSSYEKMPKRLVVYKKIFNTKILALVSAVVQYKTDKKNFGPEMFSGVLINARHWRGKRKV